MKYELLDYGFLPKVFYIYRFIPKFRIIHDITDEISNCNSQEIEFSCKNYDKPDSCIENDCVLFPVVGNANLNCMSSPQNLQDW